MSTNEMCEDVSASSLVAQWNVLVPSDGVTAIKLESITLDKALFFRIGTIRVTCALDISSVSVPAVGLRIGKTIKQNSLKLVTAS